jgi:hypothetical protein
MGRSETLAAIQRLHVIRTHDPFNAPTDNFDGRLSGQPGINDRFGSALIDRYSSFNFMRPGGTVLSDYPRRL